MTKYRIFYNKDCAKYGVQRFGDLWGDGMGDRWQQVLHYGRPAYTKYEGVAKRWMNDIINNYEKEWKEQEKQYKLRNERVRKEADDRYYTHFKERVI